MSFFEIPKVSLQDWIFIGSDFFKATKHKYHLAKWDIMCCPKDQEGLGIIDLWIKNEYLLNKWIFRLLNEEGTWQTLLKKVSECKIFYSGSY